MTHRVRDYALDLLNEGVPHGTVPALLRRRFGSTKEVREVTGRGEGGCAEVGALGSRRHGGRP
jgi:hypothetical protein